MEMVLAATPPWLSHGIDGEALTDQCEVVLWNVRWVLNDNSLAGAVPGRREVR